MLDHDTFLLELYVCADEFCKHSLAEPVHPGPDAALSPAEMLTLSIFGQWSHFSSERGYWRFAERRLRPLFPTLPDHSQFVRQQRQQERLLAGFFQHLARQLQAPESPFEILDRVAVATRHVGRRGSEWLAGYAAIGYSNRLGFFHGLQLLTAISADGVLTGFGVGAGNSKDQPMAESFLALRDQADGRFPSVGAAAGSQTYVVDKGFSGPKLHQHWRIEYGATIVCAPQRRHGPRWSRPLRRWLASLRQIIESVHEKLLQCFRLERERPHTMGGFFTRLAAKAALHNFCIWLNRQHGRPNLAFADLIDW
jgi:hypothetical protein